MNRKSPLTKKKSKKKLTQRAKLAAQPKKFARGKRVESIEAFKGANPEPIVLDRVAKTFAKLEADRAAMETPIILDGFLEHADERGSIFNIMHEPVGAVALITSRENTVRANHWHKEDAHLCFVVKGRIEYYERPVSSTTPAEKYVISEGEGFYTGPRMEHAMYFPEETTFITLGRLSRTPDEYERDLVRLEGASKLVVPLSKEAFLEKLGITSKVKTLDETPAESAAQTEAPPPPAAEATTTTTPEA